MQFVIIAHDGTGQDALSRRMAAREAHLERGDQAKSKKELLYGLALLNENNDMCGSIMVIDLPSRKHVNEWLQDEPYMIGKVWQNIEIISCKIGPSFLPAKAFP